jgi:tetratricopeptide (TPR) repeat protein
MTLEVLRGELERLFAPADLRELCRRYLGMDPETLGRGATDGTLASAVVAHCQQTDTVAALVDVVIATCPGADKRLGELRLAGHGPEDQVAVGQSIGPYTIDLRIAEGPLATIVRARSGEAVLRLRLLKQSMLADRSGLERYLAAARLGAELVQQGLPAAVRAGDLGGKTGVAQLFVEGEPLARRLARPTPLVKAWPLLRAILGPLAALHARRLVHGALHAGNVLVRGTEEDPAVVLLDAGAHFLRTSTLAGWIASRRVGLGVVAFAAPEQLVGELPTPRSDVYSFGVLLSAVLRGGMPFEPSGREVVRRLFASAPDPLSFALPRGWVLPELDELVISMLDEDPQKRPADAEAVFDALSGMAGYSAATTRKFPDGELDAQIERLLADPTNEMSAALLETSIEHGADPRRVAEALRLAADQLDGDESGRTARRRLLTRAGALYEGAIGDPAAAEQTYRLLLQADRHEEEAWSALERVYRRRGSWDTLVELLVDRTEQTVAPGERARTFAKVGGILQSKLDDPDQARIAFTQAFVEDPGNEAHAQAVEQLSAATPSAWQEVLEACSRAVTAPIPSERRNQILAVMGAWYAAHLGRADRARQCFEAILLAEPAHDVALAALADLHRNAQQWRDLSVVLLLRADATVNHALAHELRVDAARVLAQHLKDPEAAAALYEQVLREDPTHAEARRALSDHYLKLGARADRLRVLRSGTDSASAPARRDSLCELAQAHAERFDELPKAIELWERALAEEPTNAAVLRSLELAYGAVGRKDALAENLERQLELGMVPGARVALLERLAKVQRADFLDREGAARTLERIIEIDPGHATALEELTKLHRELEHWDALALTLERRATQLPDREARVSALSELAALSANELLQPERAIAAWEQVLLLQPADRNALDALATLRTQAGEADKAIDALLSLADSDATPAGRADHLLRAGRLLASRRDTHAAIDCYRRALEGAPGHCQAARQLATMLLERGDVGPAVDVLERAAAAAQGDVDQADLAAELALVLAANVGDAGRARAAAARALQHDASHVRAHRVLGDLDRAAGRWDAAREHYDAVVRDAGRLAPAGGVALLHARADVLAKAGHTRDAWQAIEDLLTRYPEDADALQAASDVSFTLDDPARALDLATQVVDKYGGSLPPGLLAIVLHRQGESLRRAGRDGEAIGPLERSAAMDPAAAAPLRSLADVFGSTERWADQERALGQLLLRVSGEAKTDLLVELGDLAAGALKDPGSAAKSYLAALADRPGDRRILLKLVQLHSKERDWGHLVEDILELSSITEDVQQKAKYLHTAARIAASEQSDPERAKELLDRALRLDPFSESILSASLALRSRLGDTDGVRVLLEGQIRVAAELNDRDRALRLVNRLADLHLAELNADDAIAINQAALELTGEDPEREDILAELYATDPVRYLDRAVRLERQILARDPFRPEPYQVLRRMYEAAKRRDATWCCCQSLVCLHRAGSEEDRYWKEHRRGVPIPDTARITEDDWEKLVVHPDVDRALMHIFVQIHPVIASTRGRSLEELGLDEQAAIPPASFPGTIGWALGLASSVLRQQLPLLFEDPDATSAIQLGRGQRRLLLLSRQALRAIVPAQQAAFVAAAHLTYCRPGFYARTLLPLVGLKAWMLAAIKVVAPRMPIAAELEGPATEAYELLRSRLSGGVQERIAGPVDELLKKGARADVSRWLAGVDLTSDRVGLIVCDDLATALNAVRAAGDGAASVPVAERMRALMQYSVSQEYLTLRDRLRVGVDWHDLEEIPPSSATGAPPPSRP